MQYIYVAIESHPTTIRASGINPKNDLLNLAEELEK